MATLIQLRVTGVQRTYCGDREGQVAHPLHRLPGAHAVVARALMRQISTNVDPTRGATKQLRQKQGELRSEGD